VAKCRVECCSSYYATKTIAIARKFGLRTLGAAEPNVAEPNVGSEIAQ
jgi:hypothetical protein